MGIGLVVFAIVLGLFIAPNPADLDDDGDPFTGRWLVNGIDPLGVEYSGALTVSEVGSEYELTWIVTGFVRTGSGELDGERLDVTWEVVEGIGPARTGTGSYVIEDNTLQGTVTIDGTEGFGTEEGFPPR